MSFFLSFQPRAFHHQPVSGRPAGRRADSSTPPGVSGRAPHLPGRNSTAAASAWTAGGAAPAAQVRGLANAARAASNSPRPRCRRAAFSASPAACCRNSRSSGLAARALLHALVGLGRVADSLVQAGRRLQDLQVVRKSAGAPPRLPAMAFVRLAGVLAEQLQGRGEPVGGQLAGPAETFLRPTVERLARPPASSAVPRSKKSKTRRTRRTRRPLRRSASRGRCRPMRSSTRARAACRCCAGPAGRGPGDPLLVLGPEPVGHIEPTHLLHDQRLQPVELRVVRRRAETRL